MKSNKSLLLIVLALAIAGSWFYFTRNDSTISEALRDFKVKDTAAVTKVFIAERNGRTILLEKQPSGEWMMNGKVKARPDAVRTLLGTMHDIEVRSPVGKMAYNNVIKTLASTGIKVEVYDKTGLIKTYYVGGPTQDQLGTFMYLQNSTVPFITHIPGFDGYLTPRFAINPDDWMEKNVFHVTAGSFKSLSVTDRTQPLKTYTITGNNDGNYTLLNEAGKPLDGISQDKILNYLELYRSLNYEMREQTLSQFQHDSLLKMQPFRSISLTDNNNVTTSIDLWRRPITASTQHKGFEDGSPFNFDVDRMTASLNKDTSLIVVQYYSFERLFRKTTDFMNTTNKK